MALLHSLVSLGKRKKSLLGIMGWVFRHSLIHFVEGMGEEEEKWLKKEKKISLHRKKECAERGQQSSLFEMSVLGALQLLSRGPTHLQF